jgi:hypothetical protein
MVLRLRYTYLNSAVSKFADADDHEHGFRSRLDCVDTTSGSSKAFDLVGDGISRFRHGPFTEKSVSNGDSWLSELPLLQCSMDGSDELLRFRRPDNGSIRSILWSRPRRRNDLDDLSFRILAAEDFGQLPTRVLRQGVAEDQYIKMGALNLLACVFL